MRTAEHDVDDVVVAGHEGSAVGVVVAETLAGAEDAGDAVTTTVHVIKNTQHRTFSTRRIDTAALLLVPRSTTAAGTLSATSASVNGRAVGSDSQSGGS